MRSASSRTAAFYRLRGLVLTLLFSALGAAFLWWWEGERAQGRGLMGPGLAGALLPAVYFATELIFGRSVPDLATRWDALRGWQRGLIGTVLALVLFAVIGIVGVLMAG
ncbi:MAG: hypothetical protein AB7G12_09530 [Thermoanaerobaculia bacterium]